MSKDPASEAYGLRVMTYARLNNISCAEAAKDIARLDRAEESLKDCHVQGENMSLETIESLAACVEAVKLSKKCPLCDGHGGWKIGTFDARGGPDGEDIQECDVCQGTGVIQQ